MRKKNSNGKITINFDTIEDFRRYLDANEDVETNKYSSHKEGREEFSGTKDYKEFREDRLVNGNKELLTKMKKEIHKEVDKLESKYIEETQYQFDVVGDFFDVGTYMSGEPEHWLKEIKIKDEKFIHVKIGGVYPYKISSKTIQDNATKLIALLRVMEGKGFLTKIDVCFNSVNMCNGRGSKKLLIEIPLKDYNQPLDYRKISTLLDVSFFRRGIFRVYELTYPNNLSSTYGKVEPRKQYINLANYKEVNSLESKLLKDEK